MMFATSTMAARLERAEASLVADMTAAVGRRRGAASVYIEPIGGGTAVFGGPGSPLSKVAGLGFTPFEDEQLAAVEHAFEARETPLRVELSTLADPAVGARLTRRGYVLSGFENVLGLGLDASTAEAPATPDIRVGPAPDASRQWIDVVASGFLTPDVFDGPPPTESFGREALEEVFEDTSAVPGFARYLAWRGSAVAGGGGLRMWNGVAQLSGASTLPKHRRHGVQTALLKFRLADAARAGCDIAVVTTEPGSKSQHNVQRQGFSLLYSRAVLIRG
jgi:GNAT superfamily N-acetyltransferase